MLAALSSIYITASNFYWVTTPFQSAVNLIEWAQQHLRKTVDDAQKDLITLAGRYHVTSDAIGRHKVKEEILKKADHIESQARYAQTVSKRLASMAGGKIVVFYFFAFRFLSSLAATVLVFAGIYRGLFKTNAEAFSGEGMPNLWFSFYYSVVTFFTVGDGTVSPRAFESQLAVVAQVVLAVITLTVLALSFSTFSVDVAQENTAGIGAAVTGHAELCMSALRTHLGVSKSTPSEAMVELKSEFDKCLRRARKAKDRDSRSVNPAPAAPSAHPNSPSEEPDEEST